MTTDSPGWEMAETPERELWDQEHTHLEERAMSWTMRADDTGFEQPPTGPTAAVLTRIVDIGTHTDTGQYGEQRRHQVVFMWELAEKMDDGRPYTIQKFYTLSTNKKANLRKDLEAWRGKAYHPDEDIEITAGLGKTCFLNVGETETGRSKVLSIAKLPKGMAPLEPVGPLLVFRLDEPDERVFSQLSDFHQDKIMSSEEKSGRPSTPAQQTGHRPVAQAATDANLPDDDFDDDLPF